MQAVSFQLPALEPFDGDPYQLPLFLFQIKLRFAFNSMVEQAPEEDKVHMAIGYLEDGAFAYFARYLGDYLSNKEGYRKRDTDEMFGNFQVFEDRLRLLFGCRTKEAEEEYPSVRGRKLVSRYS